MKIRIGFVSNSSTTSFCIFGVCLEENEAVDLLVKNGIISQDVADGGDSGEILWNLEKDHGVECSMGESDDYVFIGVDFTTIPDDVVVGEWKKDQEKLIKKVFGPEIKCSVCSEGRSDH